MANVQSNKPLPGYPVDVSNKHLSIFDHYGPASYANIGTNSGVGDVVKASALGWGGFDTVNPHFAGYSQSGNYIVKVFTTSATTVPALTPSPGGAFPQFVLQWFTTSAAFGAISTEVTNTTDLSAEIVRLWTMGV